MESINVGQAKPDRLISPDLAIVGSRAGRRCDGPHLPVGYHIDLESLAITHFGDLVLIRFLLLLISLTSLSYAQANAPAPPPKFELDTFYMAIMKKAAGFDQSRAEKNWKAHQAYWQQIATNGNLVASGPVSGQDGSIMAVMIYRAKTQDEAVTTAGNDPMTKQGLWAPTVHSWMTQKGVLPAV